MPLKERYILMLEDDHDDRYFTHTVMKELNITVPLQFLSNTDDLFPTLEQNEPILIIVDFNLHPETGLEVLKRVRKHSSYQHIPVVLLGDSTNTDFIAECYRCGANTYATKPSTIDSTQKKISLFFKYWLEVAETLTPVQENKNA